MTYTKAEIDAALVDSTRRWSFKHEIIDGNGESKGLVDVADCKINHNSLARGVKRTAKFKMTPESLSKIDLNNDRLRSFALLEMPDGGWHEWPVGTFMLATASNKWIGRSRSREVKATSKRMHRLTKRALVLNPGSNGTPVMTAELEARGWLVTETASMIYTGNAAQYDLVVADFNTASLSFTYRDWLEDLYDMGVSILSNGPLSSSWTLFTSALTATTTGNLRSVRPAQTGDLPIAYNWHAYTDEANTQYYTLQAGVEAIAVAPLAGNMLDHKTVGFAAEHASGNQARLVHIASAGALWSNNLISGVLDWLGEERGEFAEYKVERESVKDIVDVDGYDQLLMLEEDCILDRWVIGTSTNYRSAVAALLTTYYPIVNYGTNAVPNPSTETDTTSWESNAAFGAYVSATFARVTTHYSVGAASLRVTVPALTGTQRTWVNQFVSITNGARYRLSADVYVPSASTDIDKIGLDIVFKAGYEYVGTIPKDQWFTMTWDWTANDTGMFFGVWVEGPTAGGQFYYVDNMKVQTIETEHMLEGSDLVTPAQMEWAPGTPKLTIVNDLLQAINFETLSVTSLGIPVANSYRPPEDVAPIWSYKVDRDSVIVPGVDVELDLFKIPNVFVSVVSEPDRPTLKSIYINDDPNSLTSTVTRGRYIVQMVEPPQTEPGVDGDQAPDQATLDAKVARAAQEATQQFEIATFTTGLMPFHEDSDVCWIDYGEGPLLFREHEWSMDLKAGGLMTHRFRRVVIV